MFDYAVNPMNPAPTLVVDPVWRGSGLVSYLPYCNTVVMDVPASHEELKALHKSKFWSTLRRKERRFADTFGVLSFHVVTDEPELKRWLPQVQALFRERRGHEYTSLPWKTDEGFSPYHDAMITLARQSRAELLVLEGDDRLLSFAYCLTDRDAYYFFQHATTTAERYRRFSPGKLLVWKMITHLVDTGGYTTLDFMLGEHDYKREWGSRSQPVYLRIAEDRTPLGLVRYAAKQAFYRVKIYLQFHNETLRDLAKRMLAIWSAVGVSTTRRPRHARRAGSPV